MLEIRSAHSLKIYFSPKKKICYRKSRLSRELEKKKKLGYSLKKVLCMAIYDYLSKKLVKCV